MKKQLLIGSALFAAISAFPQSGRVARPTTGVTMENTAKRIATRLAAEIRMSEQAGATSANTTQNVIQEEPTPIASKTSSFVSSWNAIGSSVNPYGVVVASTRPLQYNEDLNAVSFVMRGGPGYPATPAPIAAAVSGVVVAMVTQDWGTTWDSTCMWNDNANWGRYPQGAILNTAGNTNINNAHMVSNAALNASGGWIGNGFSVKAIGSGNYNTTAPVTSTFFPTLSPTLGKADFTVYDFQATDDGKVVALGYVNNDANGTTNAVFGYRGARVVKGKFVSGNMVWSSDSIIPSVFSTATNTYLVARPRMVWSEDGMVGYVIQIGVQANATGNNRGYQPIIKRTSDGGNSWVDVNGIDFNLPAMSTVTNMVLSPNTNTNVTIPFFDYTEGLGLTVDKDNKLHIAALLKGTFSSHPDSLGYSFAFTNADGEQYGYRHSPGLRPYLYDFKGDGLPNSAWSVTLVDSLSSESPGTDPTTDPNGFATNPWDIVDGDKVAVESRIQLSRTPDGKYIVCTWAESDTAFTSGPGFKWNELPNIKARLIDVTTQSVNPVEINVTKPGNNNPFITTNNNVASRAYLHYASPKCVLAQTIAVSNSGPAIMLPLTSSRPYGIPLGQNSAAVHRYMSAILNFGSLTQNDIVVPQATITVGIAENAMNSANASFIYPNPAKGNANLSIDLKNNSKVEIQVFNMMGQVVSSSSSEATVGNNNLDINVIGLAKGVYMVNVKIDNAISTKKLIVE